MKALYGIIIIFSLLTVYLVYDEYKKNAQLKKVFLIVSIMESVVIVSLLVLFLL